FHLIASLIKKYEHITTQRIFPQALSHQSTQPVEPFAHVGPVPAEKIPARWYLAGFFEQVKSRDFLTLTIQNSHEEDQIHRSPDHWDLERTGIRPESV